MLSCSMWLFHKGNISLEKIKIGFGLTFFSPDDVNVSLSHPPLLWIFLSVMGNDLNDSNFYCTMTEHHAWSTRSRGR